MRVINRYSQNCAYLLDVDYNLSKMRLFPKKIAETLKSCPETGANVSGIL